MPLKAQIVDNSGYGGALAAGDYINQLVVDAARKAGLDPASNDKQAYLQYQDFYQHYIAHPEDLAKSGLVTPEQAANIVDAVATRDSGLDLGNTEIGPDGQMLRAGVTLDPEAFKETQAQIEYRNRTDDMYANNVGVDPNRFDIDPNSVSRQTNVQNGVDMGAATDRLSGTRVATPSAVQFDQTQSADARLRATAQTALAAQQNSYQANAGQLLGDAASGLAPSAAEMQMRRAGVDANAMYDRAARDAQMRARAGANQIATAQSALAAQSRGNVAGLAALNAQNQSSIAQAQLYSQLGYDTANLQGAQAQALQNAGFQASELRANEMAQSRQQLAGFGSDVRGQDLSAAQQYGTLSGQALSADQSALQNSQYNTSTYQQTATDNANRKVQVGQSLNDLDYRAREADAARRQAAQQGNQSTDLAVQQSNQGTATQRYSEDQTLAAGALSSGIQQAGAEQARGIQYETEYADTIQNNLTREANAAAGVATMAENKRQFDANRVDKIVGTSIGTAGAVVGAAVASDERVKDRQGSRPVGDFTRARDEQYTYKPQYRGLVGADNRSHVGPMAQDLPRDVQYTQGGSRVVDINRLAMRLASAVGKLQRRVGI